MVRLVKPGRDPVILVLVAAASVWWAAVLMLRYWAFDFWDWDLAIFSQALWNTSRGHPFSSIMQVPLLANHANLIAFLLVPIYRVLPHPGVLLVLKALCCTMAALPLARLAEEACGRTIARCVVLAYLLYPPLTQALYYDFDFESLAPLFLMGLWGAFLRNQWGTFLWIAWPAMALKENLPLLVAMFGLAGIIRRPNKWRWAAVTGMALIYFAVAVFVIVPAARGGQASAYWLQYAHLGRSPLDVLKNMALHPVQLAHVLASAPNAFWVWQLIAPAGVLPVIGLDRLLMALPLFLQRMLSGDPSQHTIYFSYGALPSPFIFVAAIFGIKRLLAMAKFRRAATVLLGIWLVGWAAWTQWRWGAIPPLIRNARATLLRDELDGWRAALLRQVPPAAPVIASFDFLPNLSRRPALYGFHNVYVNRRRMAEPEPFELPPEVEHVLIDVNDRQLASWMVTRAPQLAHHLQAFYQNHPWDVEAAVESLILLRRREASRRLYEVSEQSVVLPDGTFWTFAGGLRLLKPEQARLAGGVAGSVIQIPLTWQRAAPGQALYGVALSLVDERGGRVRTVFHPLGYRFYPTWMWTPGRLVREQLWLLIPSRALPGRYRLLAQLIDESRGQPVAVTAGEAVQPSSGTILLGTVEVTAGHGA